MAVLSDIDLKRILNNDEGIIILRRREKSISGLGYDLTIGFIRDTSTGKIPETIADEDNVTRYRLLAGHRYVVISKEFLYLSSQYMATLHSRGSYALKGIIVTSTTVDPNYAGCITGSLFNSSPDDIYIKKENQFATMVFHRLCTPTKTFLQINERGNPMDTQETFHGRYPNIHSDACNAGDAYYGQVRKTVEPELIDAIKRMYQKAETSTETNTETNNKIQISEEETFSTEMPVQKDSKKNQQKNRKTTNITFLIGNGLDLNVGLNTSYKSFFTYYTEKYPEDLLSKEIGKDIDKWSDLEFALGQFTDQISPQAKNSFWDSEDNLESTLVEYLQKERKRIHLEDDEIKIRIGSELLNSLTEFYKQNPDESMDSIKNTLENNDNLTEYSFITFNYTDTLEQLLDTLKERCWFLRIFPYGIPEVLHIHGNLQDGSIVFGVNDETQIANQAFKDNASKQRLIKKHINDSYRNTRVKDAQTIIDSSNIICIFGMSLGKTDKMWWQSIAEWLKEDDSRELIIFSKEEIDSRILKWERLQKQKIRNRFFDNGNIPDDIRQQIEKQIHVVINAKLFHISLTERKISN